MLLPLLFLVHSWYPPECCGNDERHCAIVKYIETTKYGETIVLTPEGVRVTVKRKFFRRMSEDAEYHLCYNRARVHRSDPHIYCFFVPGEA